MLFTVPVRTRLENFTRYCAVFLLALALPFGLLPNISFAQDSAAADLPEEVSEEAAPEVIELKTLDDDKAQELQKLLESITANREQVNILAPRVAAAEGLEYEVLATRLDRLWLRTLEQALDFAGQVVAKKKDGFDVSAFEVDVHELLDQLPAAVREAVDRISTRVVLPDISVSAMDQAIIDEHFFVAAGMVAQTYKALMAGIELAKKLGIDTTDEEDFLRRRLIDGTSNGSIYLDIAKTQAAGLRASAAMLPDDKEVLARLQLADVRVSRIASSIEANLLIMAELDIPTAQYKQQLLTVTGEITTSVFERDVIIGLLTSGGQAIVDFAVQKGPSFLVQVLIFFLIIYVFTKIGGLVQKAIRAGFQRSHNSFSVLLQTMVLSTSRNIIVILGVLIALSQVGISLGPLLTGLGIVGFIVGFALQDSLSNFASGLMILFYRPFDVGDTIEAAGARGNVSSMSLVNTTIRTFDNQSLIIPNNKIWQDVITNVTDQRQRRVDMTFGITYDEDIDRVEKLLLEVVSADERVLDDPKPMVKVGSFGDSSVDILCRPWVKTADYWDVLWDMNKKVKQAFDKEGITIPFPQRDVHVFTEQATVRPKSGSSFDAADVAEENEPGSLEDDQQ